MKMSLLEQSSIIAWLQGMKTETGQAIDLPSHSWQFDIFTDMSQVLSAQKPAQVGFTTLQALKKPYFMNKMGLDGIYTLPTANDANDLSKAKFKRLIDNNPKMEQLVKEMDTVHLKRIGKQVLYIMGTWTQKSAMMHSSDWNSYDEIDASDPAVIEQMSTRLQHSDHKIEHYFSHPSVPGHGVNKVFEISDQKHWFVKCEHCGDRQFLDWDEDIDKSSLIYELDESLPKRDQNRVKMAMYVCKACRKPISDRTRQAGEWVQKFTDRSVSGYQINLLMSQQITPKEVVKYYDEKSPEYFSNKVLGLPYAGAGNIVTAEMFFANLTDERRGHLSDKHGRPIMGLDTGLTQWFVLMDNQGIFHYGSCEDFEEVYRLMEYFPDMVCVADALGELLETRKFQKKYPGRVFMNYYDSDKKTDDIITWGEDKKFGEVRTDRNKITQTLVDEFRDRRIPLWGVEKDYYDLFLHVKNVYRQDVRKDDKGITQKNWVFTKPDHLFHACLYARIGHSRFGGMKPMIMKGKAKESVNPFDNMSIDIHGNAQTPDIIKLWEKKRKRRR